MVDAGSTVARTAHEVTRLAWSPDDRWFAYVRRSDEQVVCVEPETGRALFAWDPPRFWSGVFLAAISEEALAVVTRDRDGVRVTALAVPDGGALAEARLDVAPGDLAVEVSADGATLVLLSGLTHDARDRGYALTWLDTRTLSVVGQSRVHPVAGDRPRRMVVHPDGLWATWIAPQQSTRYDDRREVERFDRDGATLSGPSFGGSGDLRALRWVDADRLLLVIDPAAVSALDAGWTRVLLVDPARRRVLFDGEREAQRVGVALVYSEADVHPEDGRLLLAWTDRLAEPEEGAEGAATLLGRDGEVLGGWRTPTAFGGAYGAVWSGAGDEVIELVAEADERVSLLRRAGPDEAPARGRSFALPRPEGGRRPLRSWTGDRGVTASIARSPRGGWLTVAWSVGRYAGDEHLTWLAREG